MIVEGVADSIQIPCDRTQRKYAYFHPQFLKKTRKIKGLWVWTIWEALILLDSL